MPRRIYFDAAFFKTILRLFEAEPMTCWPHPAPSSVSIRRDGRIALERLAAVGTFDPSKDRLLHVLAELKPQGLPSVLDGLIRSAEGLYYRETVAAVYTRINDPSTPGRLLEGFDRLEPTIRENVIHVLGRLGKGRGVTALEILLGEHARFHGDAIIEALVVDRSSEAVEALVRAIRCPDHGHGPGRAGCPGPHQHGRKPGKASLKSSPPTGCIP